MKDTDYAFAVSAARVRETRLLSRSQTDSVITAPDEKSALRLLEDYGYSGISDNSDAALSKRLSEVTDFVTEIAPGDGVLSFLLIQNDFHNIKVFMKCAVTGDDPEAYLLTPVAIDEKTLRAAAENKTWKNIPEFASEYAVRAWDTLMETMNGQYAEVILDRGALETSVKLASDGGDTFCIKLAKLRLKTAAFRIALRCAAAGKGRELLELALPEDDTVPRAQLIGAALAGVGDVLALASENGIDVGDGEDIESFEAAASRALADMIGSAAYVSIGAAPLIAYYVRCEKEISQIRKILSCKRCGLADDEIRIRVGE